MNKRDGSLSGDRRTKTPKDFKSLGVLVRLDRSERIKEEHNFLLKMYFSVYIY